MPTIREPAKKDGKRVFHTQVRVAGFPARTASFTTRRAAERWATTVEARRRTLAEAIDRYLGEVLPSKRDARTRRARLLWWKEKLGRLKLAEITPAILVEYRGKLSREPYTRAKPDSKRSIIEGEAPRYTRTGSTINRFLAYLSHVLTVARREWHWISHNPFDGVSKLSEGRGRVRFLSEDERKRLLKETAKDATLHTFVVLALSTAARAGELWNLSWSDVDLSEGRLLLRSRRTPSRARHGYKAKPCDC
jgi:integrase